MISTRFDITDQFCGAGGSSQGAQNAGAEIAVALNHWKLAIQTHNTNFPNAIHECTDVSACEPRRYPSTRVLITSPECTNHSLAKGKKIVKNQLDMYEKLILDPAAERSRATMWDVPRFAEYHNYDSVIVENVVDARKWVMFDAWLKAMHLLGYMHKCIYRNSMHFHPTPQSRDRMYVVFWKKGNKSPDLEYMPVAYCMKCARETESIQTWKNPAKKFGKYKQQYTYNCPSCASIVEPYYYAAFNCIDWSKKGKRIGDRKKPLSDKTMERIKYGLKAYGNQPMYIAVRYSTGVDFRVKAMADEAMPTQPTHQSFAMVMPFISSSGHGGAVKSVSDPYDTQTTHQNFDLIAVPFITYGDHASVEGRVTSVANEMYTQATRQIAGLCIPPFITEHYKSGKASDIRKPINSQMTVRKHGIVTTEAFNQFINYNRNQNPSHILEPINTVATVEQLSVIDYHPDINDCFYRMIYSGEVGRAMAFNSTYVVLGTEKEKVQQYGNAVTPPVMEWIVNRVKIALD